MNHKLRASLLGEQSAEHDHALLLGNYIETQEYRSVLETRDSTVIVGRRGTGKSAMFYKLSEFWGSQKGNRVITISPDDYQTIGFRGLFRKFEGNYSHVRAAAKIVWKYGFLMEILSHISNNYKLKTEFSRFPIATEHSKRWISDSSDFFTKLIRKVVPFLKTDIQVELLIGSLNSDLQIPELEKDLVKLFEFSETKFYILVDRLDEGYENDETGAAIIAGVIALVSEFNKKFEHVRPLLFQRDNIIRSVAKFDPDYTRNIEGEVIRIHWDTYQLLNLVTKRLNNVFHLGIENNQKIWDRCTANEGPDRELQGKIGFKKCLQFTLYRPRDLLSLLNQSFYEAGKVNRDVIVLSDVEKTAKNISETRLEDLTKEYKSIIPTISPAVSVFANGNPELTYKDAISLLDMLPSIIKDDEENRNSQIDYRILGSDGILRALYSVGFLGTHDEASNSYNFCHDGRNPDREFSKSDRILIHPCYWIGLNLTKDALAPEEAEQINDEYEIKVTSLTPQIRSQKIGALTSEIGNIKVGREQAHEFENWVHTALQTIFAGHLGNVEINPNGSAIQRRDIVGTNLRNTNNWEYIYNKYGVHQVVFDAKNYAEIGRDEYRQLSTYLNGPYGTLGFIVTRDEEESIKAGNELDWVKEIYYTNNKLIIRLSYKWLLRLLSKLRNVEKHDVVENALTTMLDIYERRYLSLTSTRISKQKKK
jgi:hypothetical protein